MDKVNISEKLALFSEQWRPKVVGQVNDTHIKLVKIQGDFVWHKHDVEDELFYVLSGEMTMCFRDKEVVVAPGEFIVIPHGVEHKPKTEVETHIMLVEPAATVNTGDAGGERTVKPEWI